MNPETVTPEKFAEIVCSSAVGVTTWEILKGEDSFAIALVKLLPQNYVVSIDATRSATIVTRLAFSATGRRTESDMERDKLIFQEDTRKLHAEANQYINHGFLLATLAVTIFSAVAGWAVTQGATENTYLGFMVLDLILAALFFLSFTTGINLQLLVTYLTIREGSRWEKDFQKFEGHLEQFKDGKLTKLDKSPRMRFIHQRLARHALFVALLTISLFAPFLLKPRLGDWWALGHIVANGASWWFLLCVMWNPNKEDEPFRIRWKAAIQASAIQSIQPPPAPTATTSCPQVID